MRPQPYLRSMLRPLSLAILIAATLVAPLARAGNDDSCDIGVAPAATLLLPYFEVDFQSPPAKGRTTLFTAPNVRPVPQTAHLTVLTHAAFPPPPSHTLLPP